MPQVFLELGVLKVSWKQWLEVAFSQGSSLELRQIRREMAWESAMGGTILTVMSGKATHLDI